MKKEHEPISSKALTQALSHIHSLMLAEEQVFDDLGKLKEFLRDLKVTVDSVEEHEIIDSLRQELRNLKTLVYKDELTGALNRRGIYEEFEAFFHEALASQDRKDLRKGVVINDFSIIFFDLDNFKKINDTHGHAEGDEVLKHLAKVLRSHVRDIDAVGRLGGEEFVIGLLGASEEEACAKAESIRKVIEDEIRAGGETVTASVGVSSMKKSKAQNLHELVDTADKAMYEAKSNRGKNNVVCYSELV